MDACVCIFLTCTSSWQIIGCGIICSHMLGPATIWESQYKCNKVCTDVWRMSVIDLLWISSVKAMVLQWHTWLPRNKHGVSLHQLSPILHHLGLYLSVHLTLSLVQYILIPTHTCQARQACKFQWKCMSRQTQATCIKHLACATLQHSCFFYVTSMV